MKLEYLRDPAWQFVGIVLAIVALALTWWVHKTQATHKELAAGVLYIEPLLTVDDQIKSSVTVLYEGSPISTLQVTAFGFKNSGKLPIEKADFERPILIKMDPECRVLSCTVQSKFPSNLVIDTADAWGSVVVSPLLLNPGDHFILRLLTTGSTAKPITDARISGVSEIAPINPARGATRTRLTAIDILVTLGSVAVVIADRYYKLPEGTGFLAGGILGIMVSSVLITQLRAVHYDNSAAGRRRLQSSD